MVRSVRRLFLVLWVGVIALIVVPWGDFQGHTHWAKVGWIPFVSPPVRLRDEVANLLLFAPFGAAIALNVSRARIPVATISAAALSFTGETLQLYSHQRFPSATDVVMNTAGAVLGAYLVSRRNPSR
jgi:glycopeptide antibiotics resistance protein